MRSELLSDLLAVARWLIPLSQVHLDVVLGTD